MAELGETEDPRALIPGDPVAIGDNVVAIRGRGETMVRVGDGLRRIDTGEAWTGRAADAFRDVFVEQPGRWITAGDAFEATACALSRYAETLAWAQGQAGEAIRVWADAGDPGDEGRAQARAILESARRQVREVGDESARAISASTAEAPREPSVWTNIANWRTELDRGVREAGQELIDLGRRLDPTRLLTDPAGVARDVAGIAATRPAEFGAQISRGLVDDLA